jgi:hypothetical protein
VLGKVTIAFGVFAFFGVLVILSVLLGRDEPVGYAFVVSCEWMLRAFALACCVLDSFSGAGHMLTLRLHYKVVCRQQLRPAAIFQMTALHSAA